jgi:hypothetical protein
MIGTLTKRENTEQKKGHKLFVALMCLFVVLFFVRNVFKIEFPIVVFLGLVAIISVVGSREELVALAVSFVPFSVGFQYKYAILACIAVYILKYAKTIKYPKYAFAIVAMFVWELFHAFGWEFSPFEALRGFSELIFLALLLMADDFDFSDGLPLRTLAYCSVAAVLIVMLVSLEEYNYDFMEFLELGIRFGEANEDVLNFGFNYNQNGLGLICNMGIAGTLLLINDKKSIVLDYIAIAILLFIGLLTVSRSFALCFAGMIILYFVVQEGSTKKKVIRFITIVLFFIILFLIINAAMPQVFKNLTERFSADDVTGGRNDLFAFYNTHIFSDWKYLLFGVGMQNYGDKVNHIHNTNMNVSHNGYQETVVIWGVVGLALMVYLVYTLIKRVNKYSTKRRLVKYIPLVVQMVYIISGQFFTSGNAMICLIFAFVCMCSGEKKLIERVKTNE